MTGLRIAQVSAGPGSIPGAMVGVSQMSGVAAALVALGHHVTVFAARLLDDDRSADVEPGPAAANGFDVVYEQYSIGHRGGLELARRFGVPFVLEMDAPLSLDSSTYRAEKVTVADCIIEDELLATADLVITVSAELMLWAARRRHGPTITLSNSGVGADSLACIASVARVNC